MKKMFAAFTMMVMSLSTQMASAEEPMGCAMVRTHDVGFITAALQTPGLRRSVSKVELNVYSITAAFVIITDDDAQTTIVSVRQTCEGDLETSIMAKPLAVN